MVFTIWRITLLRASPWANDKDLGAPAIERRGFFLRYSLLLRCANSEHKCDGDDEQHASRQYQNLHGVIASKDFRGHDRMPLRGTIDWRTTRSLL